MKRRYFNNALILFSCLILVNGCKKDNYSSPKSFLTGAILYKGDSLRFSDSDPLNIELWQSGFGKLTPISVFVNESGMFSAALFDGDYKLDFPRGSYPFVLTNDQTGSDTISFHLAGSFNLNINVTPYYMLKHVLFSNEGGTVSAKFDINKVITDSRSKDIERVSLFLGKTRIVDNSNSISSTSITSADINDFNNVSIKSTIPEVIPSQSYIFARIGLKIRSIEQMIFSPVVRIKL